MPPSSVGTGVQRCSRLRDCGTKSTAQPRLRSKRISNDRNPFLSKSNCATHPPICWNRSPHTSRLFPLALVIGDSSGFEQLAPSGEPDPHLERVQHHRSRVASIVNPLRHQERSLFTHEEIAPGACVVSLGSPCLPQRHRARVDREVTEVRMEVKITGNVGGTTCIGAG